MGGVGDDHEKPPWVPPGVPWVAPWVPPAPRGRSVCAPLAWRVRAEGAWLRDSRALAGCNGVLAEGGVGIANTGEDGSKPSPASAPDIRAPRDTVRGVFEPEWFDDAASL